jgi:hypothetical protein
MIDGDKSGAAFRYMFQVVSGNKKRDVQEVEEPLCNRARLLPGPEMIIDVDDLVDPEHPAQ